MSPNVPHISDGAVRRFLSYEDAIRLAKVAFKALGERRVKMPEKLYLLVPQGDFRAMPVYLSSGKGRGVAAIKWVCVFPENYKKQLPIVIGTVILNDIRTGRPLAVIEANALTAFRTGAAGTVASQALANTDCKSLLLVGAGTQAYYQLQCHLRLFNLKRVWIWSPRWNEAKRLALGLKRKGTMFLAVKDLATAARDADIICTCTPSRKPLLKYKWLKPGVHINAIGADAKGKQELEPAILRNARIVVDDWDQARHSGEINVSFARGLIQKRNILGSLSDVLLKKVKPRRSHRDITVFDSTGLAVQDVVLANFIYRKFLAKIAKS